MHMSGRALHGFAKPHETLKRAIRFFFIELHANRGFWKIAARSNFKRQVHRLEVFCVHLFRSKLNFTKMESSFSTFRLATKLKAICEVISSSLRHSFSPITRKK